MVELAPFSAAWTSWTPTFTNLTTTSGTLTAKYLKVGRLVQFNVRFVFGASSAVTGDVNMTTPTARAEGRSGIYNLTLFDAGTGNYIGAVLPSTSDTSLLVLRALGDDAGVGSNHIIQSALSSTIPFTWGTGDEIYVSGTYEAAS